jgi:zinc finger protein
VRTVVPGPCPVCATEIQYLYQTENIPYFSELLIVSTRCPSCGYRYVDTQLLKNAVPTRWEISIESSDDMMIRVIRSMNGVITIPELGVRIDPGPACEGFVSNVEGVLGRVEGIVSNLTCWAEREEERDQARCLLEKIDRVRDGKLPITLIIDDPSGNSAIIAEKAQVCRIEGIETGINVEEEENNSGE